MEAAIRPKESSLVPPPFPHNFNQTSTLMKISSNDNFSVIALNSETNVANDVNTGASLSDDSGIPQTTNSSISSGDSYNLEMCKYGTELVESDGEVSQFDSLENCSESGMSTENFNTLKKGPLAPIDPPPEFQDSPKSTLRRTMSQSIYNSLRRSTSSNSSFLLLKDRMQEMNGTICEQTSVNDNIDSLRNTPIKKLTSQMKDFYPNAKHIFSSDSILSSNMNNIYDISKVSEFNEINVSTENCSTNSSNKLKCITKCPYYEDHSRYFKAIPSEQDVLNTTSQRFSVSNLHEIHDYDMYYGSRRIGQHRENTITRKFIRSPMTHSYHCHHYQACCGNRPNSRNSLCSRLSSSHNSLNVSSANKPDDSIFITQAMSHDALLSREITDFYTVPLDSDIYAFPIDMINSEKNENMGLKANCTRERIRKQNQNETVGRQRKKKTIEPNSIEYYGECKTFTRNLKCKFDCKSPISLCSKAEYGLNHENNFIADGMQISIDDVKEYYQSLFSEEEQTNFPPRYQSEDNLENTSNLFWNSNSINSNVREKRTHLVKTSKSSSKLCKNTTMDTLKPKSDITFTAESSRSKTHSNLQKKSVEIEKKTNQINRQNTNYTERRSKKNVYINEKRSQFTLNLKQKFCSIFRFRRSQTNDTEQVFSISENHNTFDLVDKQKKVQTRALPPVPKKNNVNEEDEKQNKDENRTFHFASSIEKVKDYGWYWGPLSSEAAEKVLSNEPDGSFIVRDSSDDHYIFSLSFKLNNCVRHVRIEQDQGTFSFGSYAKFKSQTITEFIEKAVDHSRSGRYLFFLHRRPEHGPMRVQLTNPVSRFKHVQSLQHMCRFVILKTVIRKDLIQNLPLPRRLLDYLNYKHCFSEHIENDNIQSQITD